MSPPLPPSLRPLSAKDLTFSTPEKRIQTHDDLPIFHSSPAYGLITAFIVHLNSCVSPFDPVSGVLSPLEDFYTSNPSITVAPEVDAITTLVNRLSDLVDSVPPETGPRRFGNFAFRKWLKLVEAHLSEEIVVEKCLPAAVLPAKVELLHYLTHSFGSSERLDYGTGHELSFAAFLCGVWVLGGFQSGRDEKALVFRTFDAYFKLIRKLVTTYSLEPAGSHGVWGLDDHVFLPYIFGSAQLTTFRPLVHAPLGEPSAEDLDPDLPKPADVVNRKIVDRERTQNLYFGAIGFVYDVKRGPFWEHSPILYDISGVQKGWGKINEGMLKMYDKEVLGKLPVVQHFPFGNIFRWSATETAEELEKPKLRDSAPPALPMEYTRAPWVTTGAMSSSGPSQPTTSAPWATAKSSAQSATSHPATSAQSATRLPATSAPWTSSKPSLQPATSAPWASSKPSLQPATSAPWATSTSPMTSQIEQIDGPMTRAPWSATTRAPWASPTQTTTPPSPAMPPPQQPSTVLPWEASKEPREEQMEASGVNVRTEAHLGPKRTSSPDSAMAMSGNEDRRASFGTVRVGEKGDLSGRRASRTDT